MAAATAAQGEAYGLPLPTFSTAAAAGRAGTASVSAKSGASAAGMAGVDLIGTSVFAPIER